MLGRDMTKTVLAAILGISTAAGAASPHLAQAPELHSADRIAPWIRERIGSTASVDLRICVATDGHVVSTSLVRGSGYDAFDHAVMTDVTSWRYAASDVPRCTRTTIEYRAR
jgi:TonB family protein